MPPICWYAWNGNQPIHECPTADHAIATRRRAGPPHQAVAGRRAPGRTCRTGNPFARDIAPGPHVVKAHNTLFGTTLEFEAAPGEEVRLSCANGHDGRRKTDGAAHGRGLPAGAARRGSRRGHRGAYREDVAGCPGIVVVTVSVAWAADRIFTNPKPDAHLKKLFPQAVAFSPLEGTPLHFKAYAADPEDDARRRSQSATRSGPPISCRSERGYHGAIHFLVGLDLTGHHHRRRARLRLRAVRILLGPAGRVRRAVQGQERARSVQARAGRRHGVAGHHHDDSAVRAIRDSSRAMARQFLNPASVKQQ